MSVTKEALLQVLAGSGQEHLVEDYDLLQAEEKMTLSAQIMSFTNTQWKHMNNILKDSLALLSFSNDSAGEKDTPRIAPPPASAVTNVPALLPANSSEWADMRASGMALIARGEGAVLLMAGGSGTRLGVSIPKGTYDCEKLVSGRSLFEYHCQRVRRMEHLAVAAVSAPAISLGSSGATRGLVPVIVMTSDQNDAATQQFFRDHNLFGLLPQQVFFSRQTSLPCYDEATGRVLKESRGSLCLAPSGNAGVYECLTNAKSTSSGNGQSVLAQLKERGVRYVQIVSVDNILGRLADPYFFGMAATRQAEVVLKTVSKISAAERVGVVAQVDGEWSVVEYTEIGEARSAERDPVSGELLFNCGNIASHCCSVEFLELAAKHMATSTAYHAARKIIPTLQGAAPAVKLEAFIFDLFRYAKDVPSRQKKAEHHELPDAFQIMQVVRNAEFAPIKNADSAHTDTPTTAAQLLLALHTKWVVEIITAASESGEEESANLSGSYSNEEREIALRQLRTGCCQWEISPLVSYEGEGLHAYLGLLIRRSATENGVLELGVGALGKANI